MSQEIMTGICIQLTRGSSFEDKPYLKHFKNFKDFLFYNEYHLRFSEKSIFFIKFLDNNSLDDFKNWIIKEEKAVSIFKELEVVEFGVKVATWDSMKEFFSKTSLKKIIISKGILDFKFSGWNFIREIEILEGAKGINRECFYGCTSLKKILLPDSIEYVSEYAFGKCKSLKFIRFGKNIKRIDKNAFRDYKIHWGWSDEIDKCKFYGNIEIPLDGIFYGFADDLTSWCYTDSSFIICYTSSNILIEKVKEWSETKIREQNSGYTKFNNSLLAFDNITFVGPYLNLFQKRTINAFWDKKVKLRFETKENQSESKELPIIHYKVDEDVPDEIMELLKRLDLIILNLPDFTKNYILEMKEKVLTNYHTQKKQEGLKLQLDLIQKNNTVLSWNHHEIGSAKTKALIELNRLLFDLSSQEKLLNLLNQIKFYCRILETKRTFFIKDPNTVEDLLKNIVYISSLISPDAGNFLIKKMYDILSASERECQKRLNKCISYMRYDLEINSKLDPETYLAQKIKKVYNEVTFYYENAKPYLELLDTLEMNKKLIKSYQEKDSINSDILELKFLISKLINLENQKTLRKNFEDISKKYRNIIQQILKKEDFQKEHYVKMIIALRVELHDCICKLMIFAIQEKSSKKLSEQFTNALNILYQIDKIQRKEDKMYSTSELFVLDIFEHFKKYNLLTDDKENIKVMVQKIFETGISLIKSSSSEEDLKNIEKSTYEALANIEIKVIQYVQGLKEYSKVYSKSLVSFDSYKN